MAKQKGKVENLKPCRDTETAKARGKLGGIKSGIVKREKKYMSQILADYLQKEHVVIIRDDNGEVVNREKIPASELIERTITTIMDRGDSASASIIKTLGELTEGNKLRIGGLTGDSIPFEYVEPPKPDESTS